jgi:hypothetical protein
MNQLFGLVGSVLESIYVITSEKSMDKVSLLIKACISSVTECTDLHRRSMLNGNLSTNNTLIPVFQMN